MTTPDIAGQCERLRATHTEGGPRTVRRGHLRNPDGPEAADTLERQAAEIARMREALSGLLGFVGQLTPAEFVAALYRNHATVQGLELTTREELEANLHAAVAAGFAALAARAALTGEDHDDA